MADLQTFDFSTFHLKNRFPFRLGTSSYIIPDEIIPNIRFLADKIDDIELVLFESDEISNLPSPDSLREMSKLAQENNLTYTVHLPLDCYLGHADEDKRRKSVQKCIRVINLMKALNPFAYVLHFEYNEGFMKLPDDISEWRDHLRRSAEELVEHVEPSLVTVETLHYSYELIEDIVFEYGFSTCLDIGHIVMCGYDVNRHLDRYLSNTRVFHLHGLNEGKDHQDISFLDRVLMDTLINRISSQPGKRVLTLEIFSEQDLYKSFEMLTRYAQ